MRRARVAPVPLVLAPFVGVGHALSPNSLHVPGELDPVGALPLMLVLFLGLATLGLVIGSALFPRRDEDER